MTNDELRKLNDVQAELARLAQEQRLLDGIRDRLLRDQLDNEGLDDKRFSVS